MTIPPAKARRSWHYRPKRQLVLRRHAQRQTGRFRQLLGKRVDYSGRSVIVSGPELVSKNAVCRKEWRLNFSPFVINKIINRGFAHNIRGAGRLIGTDNRRSMGNFGKRYQR